ncbi:hypothetical protein TWF281_001774 [Arthrobotrys megalospora]
MANIRSFSLWVTYLISFLVVGISALALPQPVPGAHLEPRQLSGLPTGESAYPIKAVLVSTNGNYVKFFFSTNNGKVYMGTWEKAASTSYTFEEIAPANSAKANTPISAIMFDLSTTTGTELAWTNTNKQARVFFYNQASTSILTERVWSVSGSSNVWSSGSLSGKSISGITTAGIDAYVYWRNGRYNIKLYYTNGINNILELSFGVSSYVWTGPGTITAASTQTSDAPLSFELLTPFNTGSVVFRNFYHNSGNVKDVKFDSVNGWSAGTFSVAVSGFLLLSGQLMGPPFSTYVLGIDTLSPVVTMVYCDTVYDVYTVPYPAGGTATLLTTGTSKLGNSQYVAAAGASNSVSTADAHIFTWGDSFQGFVDFIHYSGDMSVANSIGLDSAL